MRPEGVFSLVYPFITRQGLF